jgi:nicotinamidase/pyrazinamidase
VVGTEGADFPEELTFRDFDDVFDKGEYAPAYSGFEGVNDNGTKLPDWLAEHGVDSVDVVGIATDYCVRYTALDAVAAGLDARVLLDYTAAVAPERIESTYAAWKAAGVTVEGDLRVPAEDG